MVNTETKQKLIAIYQQVKSYLDNEKDNITKTIYDSSLLNNHISFFINQYSICLRISSNKDEDIYLYITKDLDLTMKELKILSKKLSKYFESWTRENFPVYKCETSLATRTHGTFVWIRINTIQNNKLYKYLEQYYTRRPIKKTPKCGGYYCLTDVDLIITYKDFTNVWILTIYNDRCLVGRANINNKDDSESYDFDNIADAVHKFNELSGQDLECD